MSYGYDSIGNRLWQTMNNLRTNYTQASGNLLTSSSGATSATYSYDGNGDLSGKVTSLGSSSYTYGAFNRLYEVGQGAGLLGKYGYDGLNRRVVSEDEHGIFSYYAYLGTDVLYSFTGTTVTDYVFADGMLIAKSVLTGSPSYYHADALGSVRLETNSNSHVGVVFSNGYQPYGQDNGPAQGSETYKFTGKPYSSSTGLYYDFQRWYDNSTGRFITQDPLPGHLRVPQSLNSYAYVLNQPTRFTDPSGAGEYECGKIKCPVGGVGPNAISGNDVTVNELPSIDVANNEVPTNTLTPEQAAQNTESTTGEVLSSVGGARPVKLGQIADSAGLSYLANEEDVNPADVSYQESFKTNSGRTIRPDFSIREGQAEPNRFVETKGGYASGTRVVGQATEYSRYMAARGGRVTYVLLQEPSQPFLVHLTTLPNVDVIPLYQF